MLLTSSEVNVMAAASEGNQKREATKHQWYSAHDISKCANRPHKGKVSKIH